MSRLNDSAVTSTFRRAAINLSHPSHVYCDHARLSGEPHPRRRCCRSGLPYRSSMLDPHRHGADARGTRVRAFHSRPCPAVASRVTTAPTIDGVLDDAAWTAAPVQSGDDWRSYNPLYGDQIRSTPPSGSHTTRRALLRVPLRRPRPVRHQDLDHAARQHLVRRLGRPQPRCAGHRADLVPPDGESERHSARHDQHHLGQRRHLAGLGLGKRRTRHRPRLRRRDQAAAADDSLQGRHEVRMGILFWRRVSRIGVSVAWPALEAGKWVFETHAPLVFKDLAAVPTRELIPSATYSHGTRTGRRRPAGILRRDRRPRLERASGASTSTVTLDATREPRFQPGGKRRVPGGGQPALPGLLLREAAVLHGRRRPLQPRRQRAGRREHALRRPHAEHRRSDLRREADRDGRSRDLRLAHSDRSGARTDRRRRRSASRQGPVCFKLRARRSG